MENPQGGHGRNDGGTESEIDTFAGISVIIPFAFLAKIFPF
jgi:hypothetical protein